MDFIKGLHKVKGKSVILTVVDRFSMYAHFITLSHPYSAALIAHVFFDVAWIPHSIVSERDPGFTNHMWRDLFKLASI